MELAAVLTAGECRLIEHVRVARAAIVDAGVVTLAKEDSFSRLRRTHWPLLDAIHELAADGDICLRVVLAADRDHGFLHAAILHRSVDLAPLALEVQALVALGRIAARSLPTTVVTVPLGSVGHCQNVMNPDFKELGVGFYDNYRWVQDFGARF